MINDEEIHTESRWRKERLARREEGVLGAAVNTISKKG